VRDLEEALARARAAKQGDDVARLNQYSEE
jgi:hypothetical protein